MLNISGINDSSFDEDIQFALVQRVPDMDHIHCLVRNMKCSLPYSEHKEHLFHPEIIMDEFERMGIVSKETALDKNCINLIRFHKNTTRKGVLCPIVIASSEDNHSSPGPQLILGEKITFVDKGKVIAIGHRHNDSLHVLQLIAYYYIMDLSYPRSFGGILGLLQHYFLQIPFACTNKLWLKKCKVL